MSAGVFSNRWWVVVASLLGLIVGSGAINTFGFSVFLKAISNDLGLSRGTVSVGMGLSAWLTALGCPLLGLLIDRFGLRAVMLPMIALFAAIIAGFSQTQRAWFLPLCALAGFTATAQTPIAYSKVVAAWFDQERGLALGIATAGVGLGTILVPQLASFLITNFGWRLGFVGLGIAILLIAFVPVALFLREPSATERAGNEPVERGQPPFQLAGLTLRETLKGTRQFWALALVYLIVATAINGALAQAVPLLTDRGIPFNVAVRSLSLAGLALIASRIVSGYCLDRIFGPYIAVLFFGLPIIGMALLVTGANGWLPMAGAVLCGIGVGAEVDLLGFFVSRYFGLRDFGSIYGILFGIYAVGVGLGPILLGLSFDRWHSYKPMFFGLELALALACLVLLTLGPYRYPAPSQPRSSAGARNAQGHPQI